MPKTYIHGLYLLISSLDLSRRNLALHGRESFEKVSSMAEYARAEINEIGGFYAYGRELIDGDSVFDFDVTNEANITNMYISNDDGSTHAMACRDMYDNVIFNGTTVNGEDIPIAPTYKKLGNMSFDNNYTDTTSIGYKLSTIIFYTVTAVVIAVIVFGSYQFVKKMRRGRRRRGQQSLYRQNQNNRRFRR